MAIKEWTQVDTPVCPYCDAHLDVDSNAHDYAPSDLSGATWRASCSCGRNFTVSPSIEWLIQEDKEE